MAKKLRLPMERWEIALVKAMLARGGYSDQEILAYIPRPARSVNHRVISELRTESNHKALRAARDDDLSDFLVTWPDIDPATGMSVRGDELHLAHNFGRDGEYKGMWVWYEGWLQRVRAHCKENVEIYQD